MQIFPPLTRLGKADMKSLAQIAAKRGLTVEERGPGHFQIIGGTCLVNYYPDSKRRSAYIAGATGKARHYISPQQAVEMAFKPSPEGWNVNPKATGEPSKRTPAEWASLLPNTKFGFKH